MDNQTSAGKIRAHSSSVAVTRSKERMHAKVGDDLPELIASTPSPSPSGVADLHGMNVLINGGTQGLGAATARLCAARGAAGLVITGLEKDRGTALAKELTERGTPTIFVEVNMAHVDSPQKVLTESIARFEVIHGLVNIAAKTDRGNVWDTTAEEWDTTMAINNRAPFLLIQGVAHSVRNAKTSVSTVSGSTVSGSGNAGSIVNIGSTVGYGGPSDLYAYSVSKGALMTLTRNAAFSLMRWGIRVNQINPGWMNTESEDAIQRKYHGATDGWLERAGEGLPYGRLLEPSEVARMIVYLLSPEAGLTTGSIIDMDQSILGSGVPNRPNQSETPR
jgi:NAD(P)-dependent dehydrogenase (short-subunit alcohol dehydrogenase family)